MKVLHVIPSIGFSSGGPSVVIRTMVRSQAEHGLNVYVVTTDGDGSRRLPTPYDLPREHERVTYQIFRRRARLYTVSPSLTWWLMRHAAEFDIIHIHGVFSFPSVAAAICARLKRRPYFLLPHGILNTWGMRNRRPWLKKLSFFFLESWILRNAAGVQFTTHPELLDAARFGVRHKSLLISYPVDVQPGTVTRGAYVALHPELAGRSIVLFLSRLDPKKGLDLLLPAFGRIRADFPNAVLVVAGDGEPAFVAGLKRLADQLSLGPELFWAGFVQGEEKRALLADSHLFVLPSYSENFGVAVVEALAAGLPVIVSDQVGIHADVGAAGAGIVIDCSSQSLEAALARLLSEPGLRSEMAANAVALAQRFAPAAATASLVKEYARAAGAR